MMQRNWLLSILLSLLASHIPLSTSRIVQDPSGPCRTHLQPCLSQSRTDSSHSIAPIELNRRASVGTKGSKVPDPDPIPGSTSGGGASPETPGGSTGYGGFQPAETEGGFEVAETEGETEGGSSTQEKTGDLSDLSDLASPSQEQASPQPSPTGWMISNAGHDPDQGSASASDPKSPTTGNVGMQKGLPGHSMAMGVLVVLFAQDV